MSLNDKPDIILLVRSYQRPNFLRQSLESLIYSDIDLCKKRYIYDDCSEDPWTKKVLSDPKYINSTPKGFELIKGYTNVGVKQSYVDALDYISSEEFDIVITVDNDIVVKPDFVNVLVSEFKKAVVKYKRLEILLTGFNPTNAHLNKIEDCGTFYRKYSCGGVNFVFHKLFLNFISDSWDKGEDNSVMNIMSTMNLPLCCLKNSVLNHMGSVGIHADGNTWDTDENFTYTDVKLLEDKGPIDSGIYFIKSVSNNRFNGSLLTCHNTLIEDSRDINSSYVIAHTKQVNNQQWKGDKWLIEQLGGGTYKIMLQNSSATNVSGITENTHLCAHFYYDSDKRNGHSLYVYVHKEFKGSVWTLIPAGENMFYIVIVIGDNEYMLSANNNINGDVRDESSMYVSATSNKNAAAKWCFEKTR